jgi:hypothetical protein
MISSYRGDICSSTGSLYMNSGPPPNTTDSSTCKGPFSESGKYFHPTEMHGITIQEGPDGNTDEMPTYWFWHPWACAKNITGCPWVGHGNASRIFDSYLSTVGHGAGMFATHVSSTPMISLYSTEHELQLMDLRLL